MAEENKILFNIIVDDKGALVGLQSTKKGIKDIDLTGQDAKKTLDTLSQSLKGIGSGEIPKSIKITQTGLDELNKSLIQSKNASGSASSAALELGRVIQDAPYGIRGMANNITQLVSQLGFATVAAGSLGAALKQMWKALMGPLGVVLAISAVVATLDYLYGANKKAEKSNEDLQSSFEELAKVIREKAVVSIKDYIKLVQQKADLDNENLKRSERLSQVESKLSSLSNERLKIEKLLELNRTNASFTRQDASKRLIEITKEENALTQEQVDIYEDASKANNDYIKEKEVFNRSTQGTIAYIKEEISILEKERDRLATSSSEWLSYASRIDDAKNALDRLMGVQELGVLGKLNEDLSRVTNLQKTLSNSKEEYEAYGAAIKKIQSQIDAITGGKEKKGKGSSDKSNEISPFKTGKELDIDIKSNEEALLRYSRDIIEQNLRNQEALELSTAKSENEKNNIKLRYAKKIAEENIKFEYDDLERRKKAEKIVVKEKYNTFKIESELRLKSYIDSIEKNDKLSDTQRKTAIDLARQQTRSLLSSADTELKSSLSEIETKYEPMFALLDTLHKARLDAFGVTNQETELEKINRYVSAYKSIMGAIMPFVQGEFERQKTLEQNKTNALNEELNKRLLNENLSKEERARIQNEIAQNDEALRKKKEIIEKKQFQITKMANIAGALTQTYSGAMAAYWNTLQNPLNKLLPDAGLLRAKINAGIATGAGLLQVAAIARQKFQSSASSAPVRGGGGGGAGGGAGDRSFNFNLVGNNRENQLVNAIQGQFNQPLKAYVVSRDMSNQQQLDANIVNSARF
jgi:hypothetical protein